MASHTSMDGIVTNTEKKKGYNIVNKIDNPQQFCNNFITYYFQNIIKGKDYSMLRDFTIFKYNNYEYKNEELVNLLDQIDKANIKVEKIEVLPSGSRRFDIMICGKFNENNYNQYFMLTHEKRNDWYVKSSIIILN